jgi:hypothetical protein
MAPKKHLIIDDVRRTTADAAGLIPLITGAFGKPKRGKEETTGLFLDRPIFRHEEPYVDQATGQWSSHTDQHLGRFAVALEASKLHITDTLLAKTGSRTALADILKFIKKVEKKLVGIIKTNKDQIAENNSAIRTKIVKYLRSVVNEAGTEKLKMASDEIQKILMKAYVTRSEKLKSNHLVNQGHLTTDVFSGLDEYANFFDTYIKTDNDSGAGEDSNAKPAQGDASKKSDTQNPAASAEQEQAADSKLETRLGAVMKIEQNRKLQTLYAKQELRSIHAFTEYVDAIHVHYDTFMESQKLNTINTSVKDKWRDIAHPVVEKSTNNDDHVNAGNAVVGSFLWAILIERCEIFSSIVRTVFTGVIGRGYDGLGDIIRKIVELSILSSTASLFVVKAADYDLETIRSADTKDKVGHIAKQVSALKHGFDNWLETSLNQIKIHSVKTILDSSEQVHASDSEELLKNIRVGIFGEKVDARWFHLTENSSVRRLYIKSTGDQIKKLVGDEYDMQNKAMTHWTKTSGPNTGTRTKALTHYVPYVQHNKLRSSILNEMASISTVSGLDGIKLQKTFAAKLIATLHYRDAVFDALYLLESTGTRAELAQKTLFTVGSVLTFTTTQLENGNIVLSSPLKTLRVYMISGSIDPTTKARTTGFNPSAKLYDSPSPWSSKFTLSEKIHELKYQHRPLTAPPRQEPPKRPASAKASPPPRPESAGKASSKAKADSKAKGGGVKAGNTGNTDSAAKRSGGKAVNTGNISGRNRKRDT